MNKLVIASAILMLGIAGAYFVVRNATMAPQTAVVTPEQNTNIDSAHPFVEQPSAAPSSLGQTPTNLTEDFTQNLTQQIAAANPNGPDTSSGQPQIAVPDANAISQQLLTEEAQKFDPSILNPVIKDSDLRVSNDNSKAALSTYIAQFEKIVTDAAQNIPASAVTGSPTLDQVSLFIPAYKNAIGAFYALSVPSSALDIQKTELTLLTKKFNILSAIANYNDDPITTAFVAPELQKVDQEFADFNTQFSNFVKASA
ncbi:MAG: hypothetical protein KGI60_03650 [Patescibacteria group bacterium]|nr:hypothetical protein [Patescibacteria group bacterium]